MNWLQKMVLGIVGKKAVVWVSAAADVDDHDFAADCEHYASSTTRTLGLLLLGIIGKAVHGVADGSMDLGQAFIHVLFAMFVLGCIFMRRALAKHGAAVNRLTAQIQSAATSAGIPGAVKPLSATAPSGIVNAVPVALLAILLAVSTAGAQTPAPAPVNRPTITVNGAAVVEFIEMLPGWKGIENFDDFAKAFLGNVSLNAVYSFRTGGGGLSSGGAAVAAPLVKANWQLDPATTWALYGGPALVVGSDKNGVFSAMEAAVWTDPVGPLLTLAQKSFSPLAWRPKQIDNLYGFVGVGVQTVGSSGAGKGEIISAGVGFKF